MDKLKRCGEGWGYSNRTDDGIIFYEMGETWISFKC